MTQRTRNWLLLAPAGAWFLVMLIIPLTVVFIFSFGERAPSGGVVLAFTFEQYSNLPARWAAFKNTMTLAPIGTLSALLIAYPLAYFLAVKVSPKWKIILLVLVIVPFWTSILIRSYAWIFLLGGRGIPALLDMIGIEGVRLINTPFAVLVGIIYGYLPLMVFPIFVSLDKLDKRLLEASSDLGARPWQTFLQITLPMSIPGIATGCMLVFIPVVGEFVIPELLGGPETLMIGRVLWQEFFNNRDWPVASALAVVMLAILIVPIILFNRSQAKEMEGKE